MANTSDPLSALRGLLTEHGPLDRDEVAALLPAAGVPDADAVVEQFLDEMAYPARQLADDRWVWLPDLLAGRVFTHRVGAEEATHDILAVTPDLDPVAAVCQHEQYQRLADGSPAQLVLPEFDDAALEQRNIPADVVGPLGGLLLAPGTLAAHGLDEGDLAGVRFSEQGLVLERVLAPAAPAAAVAAALTAILDPDEPGFFDLAVWAACAADPALFTEPTLPLGEIAAEHGLAQRGEWLAVSGFDFARWDFERDCARLAERHGIDDEAAVVLTMLLTIYRRVASLVRLSEADEDGSPKDALSAIRDRGLEGDLRQAVGLASGFGAGLHDPLLAAVLVDEALRHGHGSAAALGVLAELLEPQVPAAARVAYRWLRATAWERSGDIAAAERELLAAESMDVDWPLPLLDLARIASDRGDAEGGLALLARAGAAADHPLVQLLQRYRAEPRRDLGRNDQCWCGSGRKYKKCHLGREELPLSERAGWLHHKANQHVALSDWMELMTEVAVTRTRHDLHDLQMGDPDVLSAALDDPLVADAVLFEGGAFAEFIAVRGSLLPDDERALAEQWLAAERSLFDIEQVRPGQGLIVRDVRTGDIHQVRERTASRHLKAGMLICGRVVPAGDTMQIFGGMEPVALHQRAALIDLLDSEPDPVELVDFLSRRFAPPTLVNTEREPIVMCEAVIQIGDPTRIEAALDADYERAEDEEPPRWHEYVVSEGMQRIRASLTRTGDTLHVHTNSDNRMDRVLATLARLDPAMQVLDDTRQPMRDTREAAKLAQQQAPAGAGVVDPTDPEMAALLDRLIRHYETKWLDEPIPALDGHTPRQAADDPTRRADLLKLLDSFPAGAAAHGGMDADRLRDALGLR